MSKGWYLCLANDGDVLVHEGGTPDFSRWLPVGAKPPLTRAEAVQVAEAICEPAPDAPPGFWRFVSDPRTERDLMDRFFEAVQSATAKVRKNHGR